MIRTMLKMIFKILLALGLVAAGLTALRYLNERRSDYIEIYNNSDDEFDEDLY